MPGNVTGAFNVRRLTAEEKGRELLTVLVRNDYRCVMDALPLIPGAKLDLKHTNGSFTALGMAAARGRWEVVQALIEAGAEIDDNDNYARMTPLMRAAEGGHKDCVRRLINAGARLDFVCGVKKTARMYAEENDHAEVAEILRAAEMEATDFSKGLDKPLRATKPLGRRRAP